jgi:phosphoribosylformylglycinamidine synthase
MKPKTLILRTAGVNCDQETAHAFELAGAAAEFLHVNQLLQRPQVMADYQILAIPGGFSYGDDIAAGRIFANQIRHHLSDAFASFIEAQKPIIGICNGFQVLVKTDLLPGRIAGREGQTCTLAHNDCGRFVDRWVHLAGKSQKCVWTAGIEKLELPIAHGEGKFVPADDAIRQELWNNDQVALTYIGADGSPAGGQFPDNPTPSASWTPFSTRRGAGAERRGSARVWRSSKTPSVTSRTPSVRVFDASNACLSGMGLKSHYPANLLLGTIPPVRLC